MRDLGELSDDAAAEEAKAGSFDVSGDVVELIAECAGSVMRTGLIARCFYTAFRNLTAQHPWKFGGRLSATLEGHANSVFSPTVALAALEGGRLASAYARTIKIWHLATRACVATLEGHEGDVECLAALEGAKLASGCDGGTIKVKE